jgi:hypothetical protein
MLRLAKSLAWATALLVGTVAPVASQSPAPATPPSLEAPPLPSPERGLLDAQVGTWDATVEAFMAPGPPSTSKAVEVNTLSCGGRWLVTEFKSDFMGQPFEGHAVLGWDSLKKKLVGSWVDSAGPGLQVVEEEFDPAAKILSGFFEGPDTSGKVERMRSMTEWKDPDTRVLTMFNPGAPGKETISMRITYKRRK